MDNPFLIIHLHDEFYVVKKNIEMFILFDYFYTKIIRKEEREYFIISIIVLIVKLMAFLRL